MNKEEAKQWLAAYVEDQDSGQDPCIREALHMAETDPELAEWLALQRQLDPLLREAFSATPVPDGLVDGLLATVRGDGSNTPSRRSGWGLLMAIAAILILSLSTFLYLRFNEDLVQNLQHSITGTHPDDFDSFRDGMAYYARKVYFQLDHFAGSLDSIESWLNESSSPGYDSLPSALAALDPIGCKQLSWKGQPVSLVCFHTERGAIIHLFILERGNTDADHFDNIREVAVSSELETGGWVTDEKIYLLVGSAPEVDIEFALG